VRDDSWAPLGAAAGAIAVALFLAGALLVGERADLGAPGAEVAADLDQNRTRIQVGCALFAASMPFFVWFLATVASLTGAGGPGTRRAGAFAYGCGLVFMALFLADVTTLAVSALRPQNMAADPELAVALRDFELLAMGMAAPVAAGVFAAFAVIVLRDRAIWPRWLGWLAAITAATYLLRVGTLFTTEGAFAADGLLGIYVPVSAFAACTFMASVVLARSVTLGTDGDRLSPPRGDPAS
jgi:hypothetical protein